MKQWYALYIRPRTEKRIIKELEDLRLEHYVPMRKVLRQWSDRKKWLDVPLLPGYAFVNLLPEEFTLIYQSHYFVRFVSFEGKPVPIRDNQIKSLKIMLLEAETISTDTMNYERGEVVEIQAGPMKGFVGEVIQEQKRYKILLRLEQMGMNVTAEVNANILKRL